MTVQELKAEATRLKDEQNFQEALPFYKQIWDLEKNEWNGFRLAQCLRKLGEFDEAKTIHQYFDNNFPEFRPIRSERLWLFYSEKIKNWQNENLVEDAKVLIAQTDQYDKYTGSIFVKTVLRVVRHLVRTGENQMALEWLLKLDQSVINNTVFVFQGTTYAADRKVYFVLLADILIKLDRHVEYIENCLTSLNFNDVKHTQFKKHVIESITFDDYISRVKLALHIKHFQEEMHLRTKGGYKFIFNDRKILLISDLSHYLFCPVSFAINETFEIIANTSWEKDEWLREKLVLIDRQKLFRKNKSYEITFADTEIIVDEKCTQDFENIFNSKIISNNVTNPNPTVYSNSDNSLRGAPDYVMQHPQGFKYAITEKFSSISSADSNIPFESDLVKHYAFIEELKMLDLKYGFFLTWYWQLTNVETSNGQMKKKIVVSSYRLFKVVPSSDNNRKLKTTIDLVLKLRQTKSMDIDGSKISYANKCLNCSVVSYCNHKTGKLNKIRLPYNIDDLKIKEMKGINLDKPQNQNFNNISDLPF